MQVTVSKQPSRAEPANVVELSVETDRELLTASVQTKLIFGFLVLGVVGRSVRYFLNFPLWEDECFLCVNFIDRSYAELLQPLQYHQVAPILFLWIEATMVRLFGYNELALRLFPFLCSLGSLFLFRHLAGRLLRGTALVTAVGVFAVSYSGIRYAAEAKQYSSDLLVSLVILTFAVEWWRSRKAGWMWGLVAIAPIAVALSYPSAFVAGGASIALGALLLREREPRAWIGWCVFNVVLVGSFGAVFLLAAKDQSGAELDYMRTFWHNAFPPIASPLQLVPWLVVTHASELLAYPVGGARGASALAFIGFSAALLLLVRRRRINLLLLLLAPFAVHLVAAAIERYPYGGHVKFSQHLAPAICIMIGIGTAGIIAWLNRQRHALVVLRGTLIFLVCVGAGSICRDLANPYKTKSDMRTRAFARWFWVNAAAEGLPLCVKNDLRQDFSPDTFSELSWSAMYLCNQAIYSPLPHGHVDLSALDQVSQARPLRCVLYRDPRFEFDDAAYQVWLVEMQESYELVGKDLFPATRYDKRDKQLINVDYLETLTFVPRPETPHSRVSHAGGSAPVRRGNAGTRPLALESAVRNVAH